MASTARREAYFRHIFFGNPWVDATFPTTVAYQHIRSIASSAGEVRVVSAPKA